MPCTIFVRVVSGTASQQCNTVGQAPHLVRAAHQLRQGTFCVSYLGGVSRVGAAVNINPSHAGPPAQTPKTCLLAPALVLGPTSIPRGRAEWCQGSGPPAPAQRRETLQGA
eukprot:1195574-Prorocentrum_minimum.AAC.12